MIDPKYAIQFIVLQMLLQILRIHLWIKPIWVELLILVK